MTSQRARRTVAVIVPCHNYGRFLDEAVDSIFEQDRLPDEVLICDDGSTDDSRSRMRAIAERRPNVRIIEHDRPHGLIATFNELVRSSSTDVVIPLSADDRFGQGYVGRLVEALEGDPGIGFAYANYRTFGSESEAYEAPAFDVDLLARYNYVCGGSAFSRALFDRVGGLRAAFDKIGFEDYDFWLSAVDLGYRGIKVDGVEYLWRRHEKGSRNTSTLSSRLQLRFMLLWFHPRFHLHPRTLRAAWSYLRRR